jgi:hypothetical protein
MSAKHWMWSEADRLYRHYDGNRVTGFRIETPGHREETYAVGLSGTFVLVVLGSEHSLRCASMPDAMDRLYLRSSLSAWDC